MAYSDEVRGVFQHLSKLNARSQEATIDLGSVHPPAGSRDTRVRIEVGFHPINLRQKQWFLRYHFYRKSHRGREYCYDTDSIEDITSITGRSQIIADKLQSDYFEGRSMGRRWVQP